MVMISEDLGFTISVILTIVSYVLLMILLDRRLKVQNTFLWSVVVVLTDIYLVLFVVPSFVGG